MNQAREHFERGGFTRSVRPEKANNLAGFNLKGDLFDGFDIVIGAAKEMVQSAFESRLFFGDGDRLCQGFER